MTGAKGKDMGLLKAGKDITLGDGTVIKARVVLFDHYHIRILICNTFAPHTGRRRG